MDSQPFAGSCTTDLANPIRDVAMIESGYFTGPLGWSCAFHNNEDTPVTIRVSLICLKPAP
jgi:hypothetical protein